MHASLGKSYKNHFIIILMIYYSLRLFFSVYLLYFTLIKKFTHLKDFSMWIICCHLQIRTTELTTTRI